MVVECSRKVCFQDTQNLEVVVIAISANNLESDNMYKNYSGPILHSAGFPLLYSYRKNEIKSYEDSQMFIHTEVQYDRSTCLALRILQKIHSKFDPSSNKDGWMTTLTVTIPKDPHHAFWHRQLPRVPEFQVPEFQEKLSFETRRWGLTKDESYNHAIQRAVDIIQFIRTAVSVNSPKIPAFQLKSFTRTSISCRIVHLGAELCSMWKKSSKLLPRDSKGNDASRALLKTFLQAMQDKYDSDSYIYARPVLQYYKVSLNFIF
jgi:hypothetical protein